MSNTLFFTSVSVKQYRFVDYIITAVYEISSQFFFHSYVIRVINSCNMILYLIINIFNGLDVYVGIE